MNAFRTMVAAAVVIAGCATAAPLDSQNPQQMIGSWGGWLIKPRTFEWINLDIGDDSTFNLTGEWGISSSGFLVIRDDRVRFEGSRGWHGTFTLIGRASQQVLKLERDDRAELGKLRRLPRPE
ncbi:MAG TPA: hypothetical protein VL086_18420 [Candidatus Nitrosotalea sp.]|nr:hypothetical protein [Candidatus Nitrosotalea sp.]